MKPSGLFTYEDIVNEYLTHYIHAVPIPIKYEFLHNRIFDGKGSIITIVGRPGHGKTTLKEGIIDDLMSNNESIKVIDYQLEMPKHVILQKMLERHGIAKNNREEIIAFYKKYLAGIKDKYILIDHFVSIDSFVNTVSSIFDKDRSKIRVVCLDHALMIPGTKREVIVSLMKASVYIKNTYNAIVLLLSQLNRNLSDRSRTKQASWDNKVTDADIYDSDAFKQYSDIVISIDRPLLRGIKSYGPRGIDVDSNSYVISILKDRIYGRNEEYIYKGTNSDFRFVMEIDNLSNYSSSDDSNTYDSNNSISDDINMADDDELDF